MNRDVNQSGVFKSAADELSTKIADAYLARAREDRHVQKFTFSPSTIGYGHGTCPRFWNIAFNGSWWTENTDALGIARMANGTDVHERIQALLKEADLLVAAEVEIKLSDPPIRGFIDALVKIDGETVVGEIKTTRQEVFLHKQSTMKPSPNHLLQLLIYMHATGKDKGFVLYENTNTQEFLIIPVKMTDKNKERLDNVFEWLREVYAAYKDEQLPERPLRKNTKICKNCPVFEKCWNELDKGEVKIPLMEVPTL